MTVVRVNLAGVLLVNQFVTMLWKRLNQPLTPKTALVAAGALAAVVLLSVGGWQAAKQLQTGSRSPKQIKAAIHKHLARHAQRTDFKADFDFDLGQTVTNMHASAARLREDIARLQTNAVALRAECTTLKGDLAKLQEGERAQRGRVKTAEGELVDRQRRLSQRQQELATAQTNTAQLETNLLALKAEATRLETNSAKLTNELASLQTNQPAGPGEIAAAQKTMAAKRQEAATLRSRLRDLESDLRARSHRLESLKAGVATAQTNLLTAQTNVATLQQELSASQQALASKQKEVAEMDATLAARQKDHAAANGEAATRQKELATLRRELANKEQLLANQVGAFSRDIRKRAGEAASYEALYHCIGQQLWLADRLLSSAEADRQRTALPLARESAEQATHYAEDAWLGARICEAYVWPNLERADPPDRPRHNADNLLQTCQSIFQRADEPQSAIRNFRLRLKYATSDRQKESVTYNLANALEQAGEIKEAASLYRQITDTNLTRYAEQRLAALEQKFGAAATQTK